MKSTNIARILKDIFSRATFEKITSLKWASKTLALVLVSITGILLLWIGVMAIGALIFQIIENIPFYTFAIIFIIISTGVLAIGGIILPSLWQKIVMRPRKVDAAAYGLLRRHSASIPPASPRLPFRATNNTRSSS